MKNQLSHKPLVTEARKKTMCSISDHKVGITHFVLGLSINLFHKLRNITTIVCIMLRGGEVANEEIKYA